MPLHRPKPYRKLVRTHRQSLRRWSNQRMLGQQSNLRWPCQQARLQKHWCTRLRSSVSRSCFYSTEEEVEGLGGFRAVNLQYQCRVDASKALEELCGREGERTVDVEASARRNSHVVIEPGSSSISSNPECDLDRIDGWIADAHSTSNRYCCRGGGVQGSSGIGELCRAEKSFACCSHEAPLDECAVKDNETV